MNEGDNNTDLFREEQALNEEIKKLLLLVEVHQGDERLREILIDSIRGID